MIITEKNLTRLKQLCDSHHVEMLYVFGSATGHNFKPTSDIDFLVRFKSFDLSKYFDNYIDLKNALKKIFKREIDLVEEQTVKNPILKESIDRNKKLIYG
ncbi:MAG: nucleotidyltransferase domain-containing protein [Flavobacteriales bacterium]|nr:nucleotidyltransferase domain-containing protein [Flavobacteriales bacterium]